MGKLKIQPPTIAMPCGQWLTYIIAGQKTTHILNCFSTVEMNMNFGYFNNALINLVQWYHWIPMVHTIYWNYTAKSCTVILTSRIDSFRIIRVNTTPTPLPTKVVDDVNIPISHINDADIYDIKNGSDSLYGVDKCLTIPCKKISIQHWRM